MYVYRCIVIFLQVDYCLLKPQKRFELNCCHNNHWKTWLKVASYCFLKSGENENISILISFPWVRGCCVHVFLVYYFKQHILVYFTVNNRLYTCTASTPKVFIYRNSALPPNVTVTCRLSWYSWEGVDYVDPPLSCVVHFPRVEKNVDTVYSIFIRVLKCYNLVCNKVV